MCILDVDNKIKYLGICINDNFILNYILLECNIVFLICINVGVLINVYQTILFVQFVFCNNILNW